MKTRILGAFSAIMGTLAGVLLAISAIADLPMLMVAAVVLLLVSAGALIATGVVVQNEKSTDALAGGDGELSLIGR